MSFGRLAVDGTYTPQVLIDPQGRFGINTAGNWPGGRFEVRNASGTFGIVLATANFAHGVTNAAATDVTFHHELHTSLGNVLRYFSGDDFTRWTIHGVFGHGDPTNTYPAIKFLASRRTARRRTLRPLRRSSRWPTGQPGITITRQAVTWVSARSRRPTAWTSRGHEPHSPGLDGHRQRGGYLSVMGTAETGLQSAATYHSYGPTWYNFTAKATVAGGVICGGGGVTIWGATGLTAGNSFTPNQLLAVHDTANITAYRPVTVNTVGDGLTVTDATSANLRVVLGTLNNSGTISGYLRWVQHNTGTEKGRISLLSDGSVSLSSALLLPNGAAGTPALAAATDTNTGFYFPAADQLAASVGGQRFLWLPNGNSVAAGNNALASSDNTSANVGIGYYAGSQVVGQVANTFVGTGAGQYVVPSVATSLNTCVGELAGRGREQQASLITTTR